MAELAIDPKHCILGKARRREQHEDVAAEDLLRHFELIRDCSQSPGWIEVRQVGGGLCHGRHGTAPEEDLEALVSWSLAAAWDAARIFSGVCLRNSWTQNGKMEYIPSSLFFVDIDGVSDLAMRTKLTPLMVVEDILERADKTGLRPFKIVFSGGGFHLYFKAERPMSPDERRATVRTVSSQFKNLPLIGGRPDPAVSDAGRLVGIPGTRNSKYTDRAVKTIWEDMDSCKPVSVCVPTILEKREHSSVIPDFVEGKMDPGLYSRKFLSGVWNAFPSHGVMQVVCEVLEEKMGGAYQPKIQTEYRRINRMDGALIRWPKEGGRRRWTYAVLASVVESFPDSRVLYAAASHISERMSVWVREEPGQVEDICESLVKSRLSDA